MTQRDMESSTARSPTLVEPYEGCKSLELRTECYRRGVRPTRSGPRANDNKAGYIALLRAYDNPSNTPLGPATLGQQPVVQVGPHAPLTARKRALSDADSESSTDSDVTATATVTPIAAPTVHQGAPTRATRCAKSATRTSTRKKVVNTGQPEHSFIQFNASARSAADIGAISQAMSATEHEHKRLAVEYMRLKLQVLQETREIDRVRCSNETRQQLYAELQSVIATIAQLRGLSSDSTLASDSTILADAVEDIEFFQIRRREIKQELLAMQQQQV